MGTTAAELAALRLIECDLETLAIVGQGGLFHLPLKHELQLTDFTDLALDRQLAVLALLRLGGAAIPLKALSDRLLWIGEE